MPQEEPWQAVWEPYGWCRLCWTRQRKAAWKTYNQARREGRLVPEPCSECHRENVKIVGHHTNYLRPLDVVWLCERCHGRAHREQRTK